MYIKHNRRIKKDELRSKMLSKLKKKPDKLLNDG